MSDQTSNPPAQSPMPGGLHTAQPMDASAQVLLDSIKPQLELQTGHSFSVFRGDSYRTQLVNGVNYFVKVEVAYQNSEEKDTGVSVGLFNVQQYYHLRIYKPFGPDSAPTLHSYQADKTAQDSLQHF